ncbi:LysR family transcriptional regulator ArgP [Thalassospira xianhensis]|uniref:Chromosome replication initiation inhibitor protein n=1 Tax=Thalassospira xianhensis MCCC 1A02616 TaxID=1177929 RepID=A0A367UDS7_9PROT|nr:LysR family transcriptional regulator ArgP [Thalassospira xianhensis]RCK06466.1 chromosome replication initiation inhibitor protein [Thalassospira xianhensis MCCC 1A02616]
MIDYKLLQASAEVIRHGSFEKAARDLGLTQSAISQRVKLLEDRLGQPLIIRSKPIAATDAGKRLLQHYQRVSLLEQELYEELPKLHSASHFGQIAIAVNADSLATWFVKVPKRLFDELDLLVHLTVDDEALNHEALQAGTVLGAVSLRSDPIQGCRVRPLGAMRYIMVVAPEFRDRYFASGVTADALRSCPAVNFSRHDELQNQFLNKYFGLVPGEFPAHTVPSSQGFVTVAEQGIAYAVVEEHQAAEGLRSGRLVQPCPHVIERPLYWHHWNMQSGLLSQVNEIVLGEARHYLPQIGN